MNKKNFTVKWLDTIGPHSKQTDYFDTYSPKQGVQFGLRVNPGGSKTWFIMYDRDDNGKTKRARVSLGRHPVLSLKEARDAALGKANEILDGKDPVLNRRNKKSGKTIGSIIEEEYIPAMKASGRSDGYIYRVSKDLKMLLNEELGEGKKKLSPAWDKRANEISNQDIRERVKLRTNVASVGANYSLASLRRLYNWMIDEDIDHTVEFNPCDFPKKIKKPTKENPVGRFLTDMELAKFWHALQGYKDRQSAKIIMLIILNGQRKTETCSIKKSGLLDQWGGIWELPSSITKNGKPHVIPLTGRSRRILQEAVDTSPIADSDYVFASEACHKKDLDKPVLNVRKTHAAAFEDSGLTEWVTRHDLRRTITTHLSSMGYDKEIRGKLLNHSDSKSVTDHVYNQYDFMDEKREMLEAWDKRLTEILLKYPADSEYTDTDNPKVVRLFG